ncbi:elongation factor Ts [Thiohalobacter sp. COW1]|uniref:Elongation factor Ts n=1 Tax=Thiohalobacter thiocyanaticus TaxID=585455 RepID=A0A1Z4VS47_9GAMM|nr:MULTISPECIES: translation elongation factor Ts [Thiohalobacter]BAZ94459.1 translation elongation factor Ts [Thiohalobacter thiocyanaticus]BCO30472.1 elongation factor Ts [Thiohalobacter sp. COW1]
MAISAAQVKELRERTGSGMMECKKALTEAGGDMDAAIEVLRKAGLAKADKKAGRVAAEGLIVIEAGEDGKQAALVEVNSETDFVAKKDEFRDFAEKVAKRVLASQPADLDALLAMPLSDADSQSIEEARKALVAKLGENIAVRRFVTVSTDGYLGAYLHGTRIGVLVELADANPDLARDLAMHVAASRPAAVDEQDVPAEMLAKEREIIEAQAAESGKPADIVEKMVQGRINKYLKEITLLGQPFVKDPDTSVAKLLEQAGTRVLGFNRMELGEGIEKKQENFADEVMAQVRGE